MAQIRWDAYGTMASLEILLTSRVDAASLVAGALVRSMQADVRRARVDAADILAASLWLARLSLANGSLRGLWEKPAGLQCDWPLAIVVHLCVNEFAVWVWARELGDARVRAAGSICRSIERARANFLLPFRRCCCCRRRCRSHDSE